MSPEENTPRKPGRPFRGIAIVLILLVIGFALGRFTTNGNEEPSGPTGEAATDSGAEPVLYTCSMHPQVRLPDPKAKCPICAMDLIPLGEGGGNDLGPRMMAMSEESMMLAEVRTQPVERRFVDLEIPLVGKVDYDESRVKTISAWVPGRLDRLFVDYTGVPVKTGEHLVEMYSPELYAAQEELIQALEAVKNVESSESAFVRDTARQTVEAAREKLRLLGLTRGQISEIEERGTPSAAIEIKAPIGGIVIEKDAKEGMYVKTGTPIYTVADLSMVWVQLDAYESDLPWIRYGQEVEIRTVAYGDRVFLGWISFIDPVLSERTRTVRVRVIVENLRGELRPNMFVRAVVKARVGEMDQLLTRNLKDKFVCPMHPEVVKDRQEPCDQCGMDLVHAEALGYAAEKEAVPPLVVPASAVLTTGRRAVAYVRLHGKERPTFMGVEVELGPRAGDYYIVRSGLDEGDEVVTHGNFKIDSALQLLAKTSMMSPEEGDGHGMPGRAGREASSAALETPPAFRKALARLFAGYLEVQQALGGDDPDGAKAACGKLLDRFESMPSDGLQDEAAQAWGEVKISLSRSLKSLAETGEIQKQRERFVPLSRAMEGLVRRFGPIPVHTVRRFFCPMAFNNKGAYWLQEDTVVLNPYFGAAMLRCGEMTELLSSPDGGGDAAHGNGR